MAEDSGGAFTVEVVVVEGKGETTVVTPSRRNKNKENQDNGGEENLLVPRRWRNGWHHGVVREYRSPASSSFTSASCTSVCPGLAVRGKRKSSAAHHW